MKARMLSAALFGLSGLAMPAFGAATLQFQWKFDETGTIAPSTTPASPNQVDLTLGNSTDVPTDLHGASGSGVSGLAGDRALDLSGAASMGSSGGLAKAGSFTNNAVDVASTFTVTAWVKPNSAITGFGRIFIIGADAATDNNSPNTFGLLTSTNVVGGGLEFSIAGSQKSTSFSLPVDEWTFIAATYDDATNSVTFYRGDLVNAVAPVATFTDYLAAAPDLNGAGSTSTVLIGNRNDNARVFDGLIDDVRFYSGAFDSTDDINAVRLSAVPEPASLGLIGLGLLALRRRRS